MSVTELEGHRIHVDDEGFLTDPTEWDENLAWRPSPDGSASS